MISFGGALTLVADTYRFFNQSFSGNPRKMVATWAEKEMRNLGRLNSANIPSPRPLELRSHGKSCSDTLLKKILRARP